MGPAAAANDVWNGRDFRLRVIAANLGPVDSSSIEFAGTMSSQALNQPLVPHIRFTAEFAVTCVSESDATQTLARTVSLDSRLAAEFMPGTTELTNLQAGTVKWTARYTFSSGGTEGEFWTSFWCGQAGYVIRELEVVGVSGSAWLSWANLSPQPGTTLYSYTVPVGANTLRFAPNDGLQ